MNSPAPETPAPKRVLSIDALRGFDMFWITGGRPVLIALIGVFIAPLPPSWEYHLTHPRWEGFSAWDLIMPLFLFIVGAAMPFAFERRLDAGAQRKDLYVRIARRVAVLWILGMIAQGHRSTEAATLANERIELLRAQGCPAAGSGTETRGAYTVAWRAVAMTQPRGRAIQVNVVSPTGRGTRNDNFQTVHFCP